MLLSREPHWLSKGNFLIIFMGDDMQHFGHDIARMGVFQIQFSLAITPKVWKYRTNLGP
jgi:hypothetical protein